MTATRESLLLRRMRVSRVLDNHVYSTELQVEALNEIRAIDRLLDEGNNAKSPRITGITCISR